MDHHIGLPTTHDREIASTALLALATYLDNGHGPPSVQLIDANDRSHLIRLPWVALPLLRQILAELADGNAVKIVPIHAELTTQEAADLLNVSRPHLVKLLESNKLAYRKTGKHRRVRFDDVMTYRQARDASNMQALDALAAQAQALNLGDE